MASETSLTPTINTLYGKKWTSFGDSITARESWQKYVADKFGLIHSNCGIGSSCVSGKGETAFWQDTRLDAVKANDPDIVTIFGGANDLVQNPVLGKEYEFEKPLDQKDKMTFYGAYSYIIETLLTWKPSLEIMILGTTYGHNDGTDYSNVITYSEISEACRKVATYYGLPFVDLHGNTGFNKFTMANAPFNTYAPDHIHPNEAGGKKIASLVIAKMKECYLL